MSTRQIRALVGFTLIELLVVIAIIGVLAALLLPTVGTVRSMSKRLACTSNQRQMMAAIMVYAADNRGVTPPSDGGVTGDIVRHPHMMLMYYEYLPRDSILFAPTPPWSWGPVVWWGGYNRWPNVVSCPAVNPGPPSLSNIGWAYTMRWPTQYPVGIAAEPFNAGGSILMSSLVPTMPFLAESCAKDNPISTGYWSNYVGWWPTAPVIRITHRGMAVVSFPDGRTVARSAQQLKTENQISVLWSPP